MSTGGAQAHRKSARRKTRLLLQSGLCGLLMLGSGAGLAQAQTANQTAPAAETKADPKKDTPKKDDKAQAATPQDKATTDANASGETTSVTVTAQKPLNRIDRQAYDNTKDPDSKTGNALDALAKVPGVGVDPSGSVTLRGKDPQILINGRPSPMLQGDNRAAALQGMSSGSITSIEVMNNPGAQYGTGSGGPVINLITSAVQPPGGYVTGQLTSTGGYSAFTNGHYQTGKISLNGSLNTRSDKTRIRNGGARRSLGSSGQTLRSTESNGRSTNDYSGTNATASLEYLISKKDTLTAAYNYNNSASDGEGAGNAVIYNTAGAATDISTSKNKNENASEYQTASLTWNHTGAKVGETLKVDWRVSQGLNKFNYANLSLYSLATVPSNLAGYQTRSEGKTKSNNSTFSIDYNLPVGNDQLTTGIQIATDNNDTANHFFGPGSASATTLPPSTFGNSEYDYSQTVSAAYITYQKPFGDHWTVLGGLRAEMFELNANAVLAGLTNHVKYTTYNPSLFATYIISEKAKVRLSYSHRLQRPYATDYNPATVQTSETSVNVGQANLKPQETDSFEAGYEYSYKGTSYQMRGYYTRETGIITYVSNFIPDPLNLGNLVLRTGRQNAGTRDTSGTEFTFNGKLTPKLSLNMNANLSTVSMETPNFSKTKSVGGLSGRVAFNYSPTKTDRFQLNYSIYPKMLSTQGYRTGYGMVGMQYSRTLSPTMNLTAIFNDVARSSKTENFTTTPTVDGVSVYSRTAPTFYMALSKRFGGNASPSRSTVTVGSPVGAASPGGGGGTVIRY